MNPEFRQRLQHITRNLESANEAAQENIYTFTQLYIDPCLTSIKSCLYDCTAPCFPNRQDRLRRKRGPSRGRGQFDFDFYDDWDEDVLSSSRGMGWGNGELDGLLAGRGPSQPKRQRAMSYGARRRRDEAESDPNVIPKSSYLGFLDRLPFRFGPSGIRYKPSAANLEENPGGLRVRDVESSQLLFNETHEQTHRKGHSRQRSTTEASHSTTTSHSSRGDLIMSDEEEDAIPLDDEFATAMLSRRTTGTGISDDQGRGKYRRSGGVSKVSSQSGSNKSIEGGNSPSLSGQKSAKLAKVSSDVLEESLEIPNLPTLTDLNKEEESLRHHEEQEIIQKREAAEMLAQSMGLRTSNQSLKAAAQSDSEMASPTRDVTQSTSYAEYFAFASPVSPRSETEPFPNYQSPLMPDSPSSGRSKPADHPP